MLVFVVLPFKTQEAPAPHNASGWGGKPPSHCLRPSPSRLDAPAGHGLSLMLVTPTETGPRWELGS